MRASILGEVACGQGDRHRLFEGDDGVAGDAGWPLYLARYAALVRAGS